MMRKNRGQAAIEYLSTYGWAILVIVLVLAALMWLGIFDTQSRIPESCSFEAGINCESASLFAGNDGTVIISQITFTNQLPHDIKICGMEARTGNTPQEVPLVADCQGPAFPILASTHTGVLSWPGGYSFGASNPPMLFTLIELLVSGEMIDILTEGMHFKEGNTDQLVTGVEKGERFKGNVFLYYTIDGDVAGSARIAKGELYLTTQ
ncbi:hypothetical protein DRN67_02770 [Candidatus Micrarchaeota archaeon]|nr:MAG: hypothetical protein DRN67_02770 [Candidatus Micrarchaeota archaeon]